MRKPLSFKQTKEIRLVIAELSPTLNAYLRSVSKSAASRKTNEREVQKESKT